jgi:hypothetical protein
MNRHTKIIAAAGVALTLALPASQAFAASNKTNNALIGGALGALAGALIGNGSTTAVVGGAAAGALIGSAATSDRQRWEDRQRAAYRARYNQPYGVYQNRTGWNDTRYDRRYDQRYDQRYYRTNGGYYR